MRELRRLRWSQQQLACASQVHPEIISRLVTGKVAMPQAKTRRKILMALRQRAGELGMSPPNEVTLFPVSGEPAVYQEQWQETLITYARRINWVRRLTDELEPRALLRLRFELARREAEMATSGTLEQWAKAADVVYYAAQRTVRGDLEAVQEAQTILSQARLSWKGAIVAALAKYALLSRWTEKGSEYEWQIIARSLQGLEEEQGGPRRKRGSVPLQGNAEDF